MVEYKKGIKNKAADALSRRNEAEPNSLEGPLCRTTSVVEPSWLAEVKEMVVQLPFFKELQIKADEGMLYPIKYKKIEGVWFYKGRVLLDPKAILCTTIFHDHYEAPGGEHWAITRPFEG